MRQNTRYKDKVGNRFMDLVKNLLESESAPGNLQRIYTTGYRGREVTDLPDLLRGLEAILIDIRFAPESKPIEWSKDYLKLLLKNKYLHVPSLGNRPGKDEGRISIQNLALGIKIITDLKLNVLLMCACESEEICHRRKISEALKGREIETQEIVNWK